MQRELVGEVQSLQDLGVLAACGYEFPVGGYQFLKARRPKARRA
jgi:hypothetical protein